MKWLTGILMLGVALVLVGCGNEEPVKKNTTAASPSTGKVKVDVKEKIDADLTAVTDDAKKMTGKAKDKVETA